MDFTFTELLWLFLIYSFLGWIFEAVVGTIKNKRFTNRGFSTGPFCIVYGIAAVTMQVTLADLMNNPVFLFYRVRDTGHIYRMVYREITGAGKPAANGGIIQIRNGILTDISVWNTHYSGVSSDLSA